MHPMCEYFFYGDVDCNVRQYQTSFKPTVLETDATPFPASYVLGGKNSCSNLQDIFGSNIQTKFTKPDN